MMVLNLIFSPRVKTPVYVDNEADEAVFFATLLRCILCQPAD